jgi:hypothetical protein
MTLVYYKSSDVGRNVLPCSSMGSAGFSRSSFEGQRFEGPASLSRRRNNIGTGKAGHLLSVSKKVIITIRNFKNSALSSSSSEA